MSTELENKYRELYSKYVDLNINLHNYHIDFLKRKLKKDADIIRDDLSAIRNILLEMKKLVLAVRREHIANWKINVQNRYYYTKDGKKKIKRETKKDHGNYKSPEKTI
jgi:hypothetical protein